MLAYIIAIPANEIVVPTMMMVYMGVGMMTNPPSYNELYSLLVNGHGWTMLTAINLMLFSLLHNPVWNDHPYHLQRNQERALGCIKCGD